MNEKTKYQIHLEDTRDKLNEVSPSFCVAKWKQVTMHLQNGHTHSCHHPTTHFIPIDEIRKNPTALHNTEYKKKQRKLMLNGIRPSECDYCWRVEDQGNISDRTIKSADTWALPYIEDIASKTWDDNVDPSYVEVSFSNVCNFKCSYCGPHASSLWQDEVEKHGAYPTSNRFNNLEWLKSQKMIPIANKDENPYVDAFWKWWPTMYTSLKHFRITGGEPLLSKNTFKVLDYIIENPNPNLDFSINSNLCPPDGLLEAFIQKIETIINEKKVKKFLLFTSAEAHGAQAEYIRFGMDYNLWLKNIHMLLERIPGLTIIIMSTYNVLSVPGYKRFLEDLLEIKTKFPASSAKPVPQARLILDIPYLRYPPHQSIFILPKHYKTYFEEQLQFMNNNIEYDNGIPFGFGKFESEKMRKMLDLVSSNTETDEILLHRQDFVRFVDEHDRRRKTNFLNTFPDLSEFYKTIKDTL
jgi:organic radical activating enzyme